MILPDRGTVDGGSAARAVEDRSAAQLVEHRLGIAGLDRRETDRDIVEDLGVDAPEADEDGRPERRVTPQPDDQLHARGGHRLDEEAADVDAAVGGEVKQLRRGLPHRRVAHEPEPDTADVGLVGQAESIELQRDRPSDRPGSVDRLIGIARGPDVDDRDPGRADEVQALAFRARPQALGWRRRRLVTPRRPVVREAWPGGSPRAVRQA